MHLWRHNSFTEIHGAPDWFLAYLAKHLAVPVEMGAKPGTRFGSVYQENEQWWGSMLVGRRVPAGLTERVVFLARYYTAQGYPLPVEVVDKRVLPPDQYPWFMAQAKWRPYQDWVHRLILQGGVGIIDAPPRSGKTLMAARALDALAQPAVYTAPSVAIVRQTYEVFRKIFGDEMVSRIDGNADDKERDPSRPIVIATVASAVKLPREWWDTRRVWVIDEFHHAAADTYHQINALAENVYYRLCFTGTHWRTGDDALAMEALCSRVLASIPIPYLVKHGYLAEPFVHFIPFRGASFSAEDWRAAYELGVVTHEERNAAVVGYADQLAHEGHQVIVLTNRRSHADQLAGRIREAEVAKGGEGVLTSRTIARFTNQEFPVLVGTSVIGEGVDVPNASALIYAGGLSDSVQMMQSYFRPLTAHPGKTHGRVYDFRDLHHPTLQRQAANRLRLAEQFLPGWVHAPL